MKLTKDEPRSIEIENGIVKLTFVNNNPYSNKIDENPIIRTIEFQSDTLQKMKEDAEKYKRFFKDFDEIRNYQQIVERLKKRIEVSLEWKCNDCGLVFQMLYPHEHLTIKYVAFTQCCPCCKSKNYIGIHKNKKLQKILGEYEIKTDLDAAKFGEGVPSFRLGEENG